MLQIIQKKKINEIFLIKNYLLYSSRVRRNVENNIVLEAIQI